MQSPWKEPGPEYILHHRAPCNVKVKNMWSHTSTAPCIFMACYLIKHRDSITVLFCYFTGGLWRW